MTVGEKIIKLRKVTDMSQEDLADMLGIARQTVSKWELEETPPRIENLLVISEIFDLPMSDIVDPNIDVFTDEYMDTRISFKMKLLNGFNRDKLKLEVKQKEEKVQTKEEKSQAKAKKAQIKDEKEQPKEKKVHSKEKIVQLKEEKVKTKAPVEKKPEKSQEKILKKDSDVIETVAIAKPEAFLVRSENIQCEKKSTIRRKINKFALITGAVVAFVASVALFIWAYCETGVFAQHRNVIDEPKLHVYVEWENIIYTASAIFAVVFLVMVTVLIVKHILEKRKLKR